MRNNLCLYGALLLIFQVLVGCDAAVPVNEPPKAERAAARDADKKPAEAADDARLIVAFGDSLYAGYQLGPKDGFAPTLQKALRDNGANVTVLNAGVSGDTTAAGRARLNFVLDNAPQKVEMVILGLGGNDMLRGIRPSETRANMTAMMDELKRRNIGVIITGMLAPPNLGQEYASEFNEIFPGIAKQYGAPLYPFFLDGVVGNNALMLTDGIHPNKGGVAKVVAGIMPTVERALNAQQ